MNTSALPDDLPPVKPPSITFIFQLFVVPALIVAAVVAVWVLFGRIAVGDQDWQSLVADLNSPNAHIRYRAMNGLAQVLDSDRRLGPDGKHLSQNTQIATALSDSLTQRLTSGSVSEETLSDQVYLSRALGQLDVPEASLPPLARALDPSFDIEVRKGAVTSVAQIAGRAWERQTPVKSDAVTAGIIQLSQDGDPHLRRAAAFALGLISDDDAMQRLQVLLEDGDWMTAVNAAISLSRQGSTAGYPVLLQVMAGKVVVDPAAPADVTASELIIFRNAFKAVTDLAAKFTPAERAELITKITSLSDHHAEARVRADANAALAVLKKAN